MSASSELQKAIIENDRLNQKVNELQQEIGRRKETELLLNYHLDFIAGSIDVESGKPA